MKRLLTLVATVALVALSGCGGGGGSGSNGAAEPTTPPHGATRPMLYTGFFGTGGDQLARTSSFVNVVHVADWGPRATQQDRAEITQRAIAQMQEARARGVEAVILMTGYTMLDDSCQYRDAAELAALRSTLDALDLTRMIVATYPVDEPDVSKCSDETMNKVYTATKGIFQVPIAVIYGTLGTPGIGLADWIGWDKYGNGPQLNKIADNQLYIVISGGTNPWREQPFASFALANPRVVLDLAFLYVDFSFPVNVPQTGIGANGMLAAYCAAGKSITSKPGSC